MKLTVLQNGKVQFLLILYETFLQEFASLRSIPVGVGLVFVIVMVGVIKYVQLMVKV